jgi:hypothetical protein
MVEFVNSKKVFQSGERMKKELHPLVEKFLQNYQSIKEVLWFVVLLALKKLLQDIIFAFHCFVNKKFRISELNTKIFLLRGIRNNPATRSIQIP